LLNFLPLDDKAYTATIRLGAGASTDDREGALGEARDTGALAESGIAAAMARLTGEIMQRPSAVSAIKVGGQRAYARVRAGEAVELAARPVTVRRFALLGPIRRVGGFVDLDVEVECTSGTYVRALARDLGEALGVGGHLTALRRDRVGPFARDQAVSLERLAGLAETIMLALPAAIAATMPTRAVTTSEAAELSFGRTIDAVGIAGVYGAIGPDGEAVALLRETDARARPVLGFTPRG
jgi:tRNA pseudouridine55 synthase